MTGFRWYRSPSLAQPPANFFQASGLKNTCARFFSLLFATCLTLTAALSLAATLRAQNAQAPQQTPAPAAPAQGAGTLTGRVYLPSQDRYLENVNISIAGLPWQKTLTDAIGFYQLFNVPAGEVTVVAEFPGLPPVSAKATVIPGRVTTLDLEISETAKPATTAKGKDEDDVVHLQTFTVTASRETLGSAIAEQEQRFATNMKTVVSTDQFGNNPTGNIGEFLRNVIGVEVGVGSNGEASSIGLSGAGSEYVPISIGNFELASANNSMGSRSVDLQQISLNNISFVEVNFSPLPESPGKDLAGRVTAIPRSAFERKRPEFKFTAALLFTEREMTLGTTPGPLYEPTKKAKPSWSFSYLNPVSENFGFTVTGNYTYRTMIEDQYYYHWIGIGEQFRSDSTYPPSNVPNPFSNPYCREFDGQLESRITETTSVGITADWRLGHADRLSFAFSYTYRDEANARRDSQFKVQFVDPSASGPEHTEGTGNIRADTIAGRNYSSTIMPSLTYLHLGPVWRIEAGAGISSSKLRYGDTDNGYFRSIYSDRGRLALTMEIGQAGRMPQVIELRDTLTGAPVDYRSQDEYVITNTQSRASKSSNVKPQAYAYARRNFTVLKMPAYVKLGVHTTQEVRDYKTNYQDWTFVGADGIPASRNGSTTTPTDFSTPDSSDDHAGPFKDNTYIQSAKLLKGGLIEYPNNSLIYNLYTTHPQYFEPNAASVSNTRDSRYTQETVSSAFAQLHLAPYNGPLGELALTGGARLEHTRITGDGPLKNPATTSNSSATDWFERARHFVVDYSNLFPSMNAIFKTGQDRQWVFRLSWFKSIGRPNFEIYNGSITFPSPNSTPTNSSNLISMTSGNSLLKPWTAYTWRAEISHYNKWDGRLTLAAYTRDYTNRFIRDTYLLTSELMQQYGIGPEYEGFYVQTLSNSTYKFTQRELTLDYTQKLSKLMFIPRALKGSSVFAGASWRQKSGVEASRITGGEFAPRSYRAGIFVAVQQRGRELCSLRCNWSYTAQYISDSFESSGYDYVEVGARRYGKASTNINAELSIRLTRQLSLIVNGENLSNAPRTNQWEGGPSTPGGLKPFTIINTGRRYTFSIQGAF